MDADEIKNKSDYIIKNAIEKGADDLIVDTSINKICQIKFANNEIVQTHTWDSTDIDVFLAFKKRIVSTSISDFSKDKMDKSIQDLIKFAKVLKPSKDYNGIAEGPFNYKEIPDCYDKKILDLSNEGVDYIESAINKALVHAGRTAGVLYTTYAENYLKTSNNVEAEDKKTKIELSIRAFADKNASGHGVNCSTTLKNFNPEKAGEKAGKIAKQALNPKEGEDGKYDIIFDPLSFANLLGLTTRFASAFQVDIGESFLADKLNEKVGNDIVTLVDDGSIPGGFRSTKFDAEGVPTQKNVIIENGVLKSYLHNTSTAKKYNTKTTANAGLISPHPWNAVLEAGNHTKDELFSEVKKGLYITNIWYTRFQNYRTGDFSTIPRDGIFLIENGEITKSLKNLRVSDNLQNVFESIKALGNEQEWIHWWDASVPSLLPYVLVDGVGVTKPVD